jgi:hypothetical protein
MRRIVLTVLASAMLTFATALPVASSGLTLVALTCDDGTDITAEVDADTLEGLVQAVADLALYPAGLTCSLVQTPIASGLSGVAVAGTPGDGGFIVGGGRLLYPCPNVPALTFWVNFAVSAHTATPQAGATKGGTLNYTIPAGQCEQGHFTSKPTCLRIDAQGPKPPAGAWRAYIRAEVTQTTGDHFAQYAGRETSSGWKDTGNPSKQMSPDRVAASSGEGNCPHDQSPNPDGSGSVPILVGNVTIHRR